MVDVAWQVVHLADAAPVPWKNGGGTTRELVAWPDVEHWVWRMSVAEVAQSGPFSRFDGVQRWFSVLGGAGVVLTHNGARHALTVDSVPFCFDGALPTGCDLIGGATQDFNLMTRVAGTAKDEAGVATRAGTSANMTRVRGSATVNVNVLQNTIKIVAAYAVSTRATARFNGENTPVFAQSVVWRSVAAQDVLQIEAEDALLIEIVMEEKPMGPPNQAIQSAQTAPTRAAKRFGSAS